MKQFNCKKYKQLFTKVKSIINNLAMKRQQLNNGFQFMGDISRNKLNRIIGLTVEKCQKCFIRNKNHYCIQPKCMKKELVCWECDICLTSSRHYMHQFSYVVPLFCKEIFTGITQMKTSFANFQTQLKLEINKMDQYIQKLYKIYETVTLQLQKLQKQEIIRNFKKFQQRVNKLVKIEPFDSKLSEILADVSFLSSSQCLQKQQELKQQLLTQIESLKWLVDPQKQLKNLLNFHSRQQLRQVFIPSSRTIQIGEIDNFFRKSNQYFTETLATHKIQLKVEGDLLAKPKYYQSFVYHFRQCQNLSVTNGHLSHIRTPLLFQNLKFLELNFNVEGQCLGNRFDMVNANLSTLVLKRLRQEDIKALKVITSKSTNLKQLHLEIANKTDLSASKQLIEYLNTMMNNNLNRFTLRIRTESEVKRVYGYLSKFYKQSEAQPNLGICLIQLVRRNKNLTKVVIEGVRPLNSNDLMEKLQQIKYLFSHKVYYDNRNVLDSLDNERIKELDNICSTRRRAFYSLAKNAKFKRYERSVMRDVSDFLY